jgi:hypothetical protein
MKKSSSLFAIALLILVGTFTSCEEIKDAADITVNTDLETTFTAVPDATKSAQEGSASFISTAILDISENADLADYLESIQSIEITKIKVMITSTTPSGLKLENGTFSITDNVNGDSFAFSTPANMPIIVGAQFEIGSDAPGWDTANSIIASMNASTISAVGTIDNETYEVGFVYIVSVKVVANPLK